MSLRQVGHQSVTMMSAPGEVSGGREVEVDEVETRKGLAKSKVMIFR